MAGSSCFKANVRTYWLTENALCMIADPTFVKTTQMTIVNMTRLQKKALNFTLKPMMNYALIV